MLMTVSSSYDARRKDGALVRYPLGAGVHIRKGGLLTVAAATGLAQPASDTAGVVFIGAAYEEADNTGGAAGAISVRVLKTGVFTYAKTAAVQADVGKVAFVVDDVTVSTAATADSVACGTVVGVPDALTVQIRIDGKVG
jgi:hypothetical protein